MSKQTEELQGQEEAAGEAEDQQEAPRALSQIASVTPTTAELSRISGGGVVVAGSPSRVDRLVDDLEEARKAVSTLVKDATADKRLAGVVGRLEGIATVLDKASDQSEELKADVLLPPMDAMRVRLVPLHSLERLEEYRSDENKAYLLIGTFLGAIFGILSNWATNEDFVVTRPSAAWMIFLSILAVTSIGWACLIAHRARRVREHMQYPGVVQRRGEIVFIDRFDAGNKGWNLNYWGSRNPRRTNRIENSFMVFEATESDLKSEAFGAYFDLRNGIYQRNEYEVSCKVKSDENTTMEFSLWLHDTSGGDSNISTTSRTPSTKFEEFKLGFTANERKAIRIHLHNKPGLGRVIVDQVVVRKT